MAPRPILFLAAILWSITLSAQTYKLVNDNSSFEFRIHNFGVSVSGKFSEAKGTIAFDPNNLGSCSFKVTVESKTISTGIDMRDGHLRDDEYLDVAKYPTLSFVSTKVTSSSKDGYLFLFGDLTIKGVTKAISFPFKATHNGNGYTFTGDFTINRRDFGVGGSSISMADEVRVELKVVAEAEK